MYLLEAVMDLLNEFVAKVTPVPDHQLYLKIITVFCITFLILKIINFLIHERAKKIAKRTDNDLDDFVVRVLDSFGTIFYFVTSIWVVVLVIDEVNSRVEGIVSRVAVVVFTYYIVKALGTIVNFGIKRTISAKQEKDEKFDPTVLKILNTTIKVTFWILGIVFILQNFGYNVTAILGGIGVLGIAVAFGLQSILEEIFAFFSIYLDKPFKVGDFVVIGNGDMGTIKKIGIRSTRLKTLQGEELIVSNVDLVNTRINNFKKLQKRRVEFSFGVTYDTTSKQLKEIPKIVEEVIGAVEDADFGRTHFKKFGDSSLVFEVVYHVTKSDYSVYMDVQQEINLGIKERLEKAKIEMAFPSQTLYIKK